MIQVGFKSDKGIRRKNNEDAFFVIPNEGIFVIADGVGGNNGGEIASRTAVSNVAKYVRENPIKENFTESDLKSYFMKCLDRVNKTVYNLSKRHLENVGMATTMVIAYVAGNSAYIVNVGDSRAYLYREGALTQITEDHTYVNVLIQEGALTREEARRHEKKNVITRAIGGENRIAPDFFRVETKLGDVILLCTDGLHGEVEDETIGKILGEGRPMQETCAALVSKANQCGGRDNVTVICLKV